ncbi:MAG TPA: response regulator transcription factor [Acidimicrobiales bacterium]|nr:response regulator transcription factor [Acidimicrobiales bacterium]
MSLPAGATYEDGNGASQRQSAQHRSRLPVRVLLIADTEIIVRGLSGLLEGNRARVQLLGPVSATEDVGAAASSYRADVVLVDVDRKGGVDIGLLARLLSTAEGHRLVVFTHSSDERRLFEALRAGTAGYLLKSLSADELVQHLERARDGQVVIDPSLASRLALAMGRSRDLGGWPGARIGLSQRESDVLALLVDGLANREIAERLFVGQETVKTHLHSLYRKLEVRDRAGAVGLALRDGIFN